MDGNALHKSGMAKAVLCAMHYQNDIDGVMPVN
jgi:hypothetical protein